MTKITDDHYGLYIGGKWITPAGASLITAENPSNGDALATFVDATHADVDAAVLAARNAFPTWKK